MREVQAWFHVLAGDGEAADLAAAPGCRETRSVG